MNELELNRERRKQRALERLGTNKPRCAVCGFDDPLALELHHIAGRASMTNGPSLPQLPSALERRAEGSSARQRRSRQTLSSASAIFLLGLADLFEHVGRSAFANSRRSSSPPTRGRSQQREAAAVTKITCPSHRKVIRTSPIACRLRFAPLRRRRQRNRVTNRHAKRDQASPAAVRMDARLRHRDDGRRDAAAADRRLSISQRRRTGRSRALL